MTPPLPTEDFIAFVDEFHDHLNQCYRDPAHFRMTRKWWLRWRAIRRMYDMLTCLTAPNVIVELHDIKAMIARWQEQQEATAAELASLRRPPDKERKDS